MKAKVALGAPLGVLVLSCLTATVASNAPAAVSASGDTSMPSQDTSHSFAGGGFQITESVAFDPSFGPWIKHLINGPQSHASGANVPIVETLTNTATPAWIGWHEEVRSRTDIPGGPGDEVGFLFDDNSLLVQADYGAGFVLLTLGVDYTVVPTLYSGPPTPGNNFHWEAVSIFFAPGREIAMGNRLQIQKDIFEVFDDADPWRPDEEAIIAQFPIVPEPSALLAGAIGAGVVLICRRRTL